MCTNKINKIMNYEHVVCFFATRQDTQCIFTDISLIRVPVRGKLRKAVLHWGSHLSF